MSLKQTVARLTLFARLWIVAKQKGLVVAWSFNRLRATPRSRSKENIIGLYYSDHGLVLLGAGHFLDPYTLAHELGHHELRKRKHTEADANLKAREIISRICDANVLFLMQGEMDESLSSVE